METTIRDYINTSISDEILSDFLLNLISSSERIHNLLCLCLLIDLKSLSLVERDCVDVLESIRLQGLAITYKTFVNEMPVVFRMDADNGSGYSRVMSVPVFKSHVGSFRHNNSYVIDDKKIKDDGWNGAKGVVWISPKNELDEVLEVSIVKEYPANDVCDHLGIARTKTFANTKSPGSTHLDLIAIHYSDNFPDEVYQSNTSNADWASPDIMFLSYPNIDGWGRTYNDNGIMFAREQVHKPSTYYDKTFYSEYIGKMSVDARTESEILEEALKRLGVC